MSFLFGGIKTPPLPTYTPPADRDDAAVQEARRKELLQASLAKGRSSTLLTGGTGDTSAAPVARPTLLGG